MRHARAHELELGEAARARVDDQAVEFARAADGNIVVAHDEVAFAHRACVVWAAKEAIYKALNSIVDFEFGWHDLEIFNEPNGLPIVKLGNKFDKYLAKGNAVKISMSHSRDYVACVAIAYKA